MNSPLARTPSIAALHAGSRVKRARAISVVQWKLLLFLGSAMLAAIASLQIMLEPKPSGEWPFVVAACCCAWFGLYLVATYRYFGTPYLFLTAYVLCLGVFHLGHLFAHVTGLYDLSYLTKGDMAFWYQQANWYVMLSFACFGVGAAAALRSRRPAMPEPLDPTVADASLQHVYAIGVGLLLASIIALGLTIGSVGNLLRFSRSEIFRGVGDTRGFGFFLAVMPSAVVLLVAAARKKAQKIFAYGLAGAMVLAVLFLGYRSSVMFPGLVAAILWVKLGRRIPLPVVAVTLLAVLIAIPAVSFLRQQGAYQNLSQKDVQASIEHAQDTKDILIELGGVSTVMAYVVKAVPREWPYRLGQSYWLALKTAVPNVGLKMETGGRSEFLSKGVADREALAVMNPADWYTYIADRWLFDRGGGAGFSTIAEAYLNFGMPGVVLFFGLLGYLLAKLDQQNLLANPKLLVIAGAMLWPLLKTVRNSFDVFLKPLMFLLVSIWIWRAVTFWMRQRR